MFISYGNRRTILGEGHDRLPARLTVGKDERLTGTLTLHPLARPSAPPSACPSLCVYLLVRPISSLARLCDWNKNEACVNLQTGKRARTFRPIYPLSLFVCACPFAVVLLPVLIFIPAVICFCLCFPLSSILLHPRSLSYAVPLLLYHNLTTIMDNKTPILRIVKVYKGYTEPLNIVWEVLFYPECLQYQ